MAQIKIAALAALTMMILDGIWLGLISKTLYFENLKHLARINAAGTGIDVLYGPAALVYVMMLLIFTFFLAPQVLPMEWGKMLMWAGLFGFLVYGIYDFTNMATLRDWPVVLSLIDMVWGGIVFASAASAVKACGLVGT